MRIIAGVARGRKLLAPPGRDTRPVLDSLKESLFNILRGEVDQAVVWDLFSGSGSMGLEALSRGARLAHFVDRGRPALDALRKNIAALGMEECSRIHSCDVFRFAPGPRDEPPDLVFFDPPFPLVQRAPGKMSDHLSHLAGELKDAGLIVYRSPSAEPLREAPPGLVLEDFREKGVNALHFLRRL